MKNTKFKLMYVNGLKQNPKDTDFHITPVLTFGRSNEFKIGKAWGLCAEWGHWAVGFGVFTTNIN